MIAATPPRGTSITALRVRGTTNAVGVVVSANHMTTLHSTVLRVTQRIAQRSQGPRAAYLARLDRLSKRARGTDRMGCANVAHAVAALPANDKLKMVAERAPNLAIVTAYNDMLSAHRPYENYPELIRNEARRHGATAQVAGGTPAMCDGVTQGLPGMDMSLFSRDTIAMATAIALTHDVFDAALLLGICDKIVPGLLIGALHFGHLPCVFIPAGPMSTGLSNDAKSKVREQHAQGLVGREALLEAENAAYHGEGTCTFYGTANSNQMLLEAMGLHVPGSAFVHPHATLREALTREAVRLALASTMARRYAPIGRVVDERCIVNAMVALLATGGSTNHLIHWVAVARAAGIAIDWDDFSELSSVVPLLARVYPNGSADVNQFQAAGGPGFVIRELLGAGLMHADVLAMSEHGIAAHARVPVAVGASDAAVGAPDAAVGASDAAEGAALAWRDLPAASGDATVVRPSADPFSATGGLKLLQGRLGRGVIKSSAVPEDRWVVEAPARVFESQEAFQTAFKAGELTRDVVAVVRFQGPRANGMPELHKLTPPLAVLQGKGFRVALVTDGRMSGASGKVPAAIHVVPEALDGGPIARVRDGDRIRIDAVQGLIDVLVDDDEWNARPVATRSTEAADTANHDLGRELFAGMRRNVSNAEEGAVTWAH
jgi:phosphogluconate dehydratase